MALKVGAQAPDFTLPGSAGKPVTLSAMAGKPILLFFYPKDFTRVCTSEACSFRDNYSQFTQLGIPIFGVSRDSVASHSDFKVQHHLPYELLSDPAGAVCRAYDALLPLVGIPARITYLLGPDHKIEAVYNNLFLADGHIYKMLEHIRRHHLESEWGLSATPAVKE